MLSPFGYCNIHEIFFANANLHMHEERNRKIDFTCEAFWKINVKQFGKFIENIQILEKLKKT